MRKLKIQMSGRSDEFQTPEVAINPLIPFLRKDWVIWECAWGKGSLARHLEKRGFKVIGNKREDFIEQDIKEFDCIVTNPPYSKKDEFLRICYVWGKPFALLMPITALEGKKRGKLYKEHGIRLIIPNKRINFITPSGKGSGAWFQVAWFCWGIDLPKELNFVDLNAKSSANASCGKFSQGEK